MGKKTKGMSLGFVLTVGAGQIQFRETFKKALQRFGDRACRLWLKKSEENLHWAREVWA